MKTPRLSHADRVHDALLDTGAAVAPTSYAQTRTRTRTRSAQYAIAAHLHEN